MIGNEVAVNAFRSTSHSPSAESEFNFKDKKPGALDLALFVLFYLAASAYIPTLLTLSLGSTLRSALAVSAISLSIAVQVRMIRSFPGALGYIVTVLLIGTLTGSFDLAAFLGILITAACILAWLCLTVRSPLLGLLPVGAYTVSALLLRAPLGATLALLPIPCALVMASALRRETARVASICRIALALGGTVLSALLIYLFRQCGTLTPALLQELLESVRAGAIGAMTEVIQSAGLPQGISTDVFAYAETLINTLFNYLPALVCIFFIVIGWMLHTAILRVALGNDIPKESAAKMLSFDMSMSSAVVFMLALLLSLIFVTDDTALFGIISGNICLLLMPGMLMTAWIALNMLLLHRAPSCLSVLLYLAVFFLLFTFSFAMLPLFAAFGATVVIVGRIRRYLSEKHS